MRFLRQIQYTTKASRYRVWLIISQLWARFSPKALLSKKH